MHLICEVSEVCLRYMQFQVFKGKSPEVKSHIWPEFELVQDFMPVLVTCRFDEDQIKNVSAIVSTICVWEIFSANSKGNGQIWPEFQLD